METASERGLADETTNNNTKYSNIRRTHIQRAELQWQWLAVRPRSSRLFVVPLS